MKIARRRVGLLISGTSFVLAAVALPGVGRAAEYNWVGLAASSADWSSSSNWEFFTLPVNDINNTVIDFQNGAARSTANLNSNRTINRLEFTSSLGSSQAFTLDSSNGSTLSIGDGGIRNFSNRDQVINHAINVSQNQSWQTTDRDLYHYGNRSGSANLGLNLTGGSSARRIYLYGSGGSHTGDVTVSSGILEIGDVDAFSSSTRVQVEAGATLDMNNTPEDFGNLLGSGTVNIGNGSLGVGLTNNNATFSGSLNGGLAGRFNKLGAGVMTLGGNNFGFTGRYTVSSGTLQFGANSTISDSSIVAIASGAQLQVLNDENIGGIEGGGNVVLGANLGVGYGALPPGAFSGNISGTGNLTTGGGFFTQFSGNNAFDGNVTVASGILQITAGRLAINNLTINGTLLHQGGRIEAKSVTGNLNNNSGGTFVPRRTSNAVPATALTGNYLQAANSTLEIDVTNSALATRLSATGNVTLAGELELIRSSGSPGYSTSYTIIIGGNSITGVFSTITGISIDANKSWAVFYTPTAVTAQVALPGDADDNGTVNFDDLLVLAANYNVTTNRTWSQGDFTGNGAVNFDDLLVLAARYNSSATGSFDGDFALAQTLVPEPAALSALLATGACVARRRRR